MYPSDDCGINRNETRQNRAILNVVCYMGKKKDAVRHMVSFQPLGQIGQCSESESLLDCAHRLNIGIINLCGGMGNCGACRLRVLSGVLSTTTSAEIGIFSTRELAEGFRLACQAYPSSDCTVEILQESMITLQRTQLESLPVSIQLKPAVNAYRVGIIPPSLDDQRADADRLLDTLKEYHGVRCNHVNIAILRILSSQLRSWDWQCQATLRNGEVSSIRPWQSTPLGLAIDLGTTKIAGYLVNLNDGSTLSAQGIMNPQIKYGEEIISRIAVAMDSVSSARKIQKATIKALNDMVKSLCRQVGAQRDDILDAVVVGNTAMSHLLLGLPVTYLAHSPYVPAISRALDISAADLELHIATGAYVHVLPNIAGFVGGDHVAMLLATRPRQASGPVIAIDIGTNTEVSLVEGGGIHTVSCASGPAFEGGHIKNGMRASSGAIERVQIGNTGVYYQTIDDTKPIGICGSGAIDTLAQLYRAGIVNSDGRLIARHPRIREGKECREFILADESQSKGEKVIVITQHDIRELQLAKAAIRAGIEILLKRSNITLDSIREVVIAGAFGTYIDVASAVTIGMLPSLPLAHFRQVGNAAGAGARLALLSVAQREEAQKLATQVRYLELAGIPNFTQTLIEATRLGIYRL